MIASIQTLVPQFVVRHAVFCRGTVRVQGPKAGTDLSDIPLRMTMVVRRDTGVIEADGSVEQWTKIPKYHRARKGVPAKFSVTVFGAPREEVPQEPVSGADVGAGAVEGPRPMEEEPSQPSAGFPHPPQNVVALPEAAPASEYSQQRRYRVAKGCPKWFGDRLSP